MQAATKRKNGNGEGSIRFNQRTKKWEARCTFGFRPDGTAVRISRSADSEKEANKLLKEMHDEAETQKRSGIDAKNATVEEYYTRWLKARSLKLKPRSFDTLESTVQYQVLPYIGMMQLQNVTTDHLQDILYDLIDQNYSYSTIKKTYNALTACFRYAMVRGDLVRSPMMGVVLPEKNSGVVPLPRVMQPFTLAECTMITNEASRKYRTGQNIYRLGAMFVLMLNTGIRLGEALALKYSDIDWDKKTIHICRSANLVKNRSAEGRAYEILIADSVKSKSSFRYIGLNTAAIRAIEELQKVTGNHEFIATNTKGGHITGRNFAKTFFGLLQTLQIVPRGLHNLRHTFATQLFEKKVDIKYISALLGHSSVQITYDTYVHIVESQKNEAVHTIDFLDAGDVYKVINLDA